MTESSNAINDYLNNGGIELNREIDGIVQEKCGNVCILEHLNNLATSTARIREDKVQKEALDACSKNNVKLFVVEILRALEICAKSEKREMTITYISNTAIHVSFYAIINGVDAKWTRQNRDVNDLVPQQYLTTMQFDGTTELDAKRELFLTTLFRLVNAFIPMTRRVLCGYDCWIVSW